MDKTLIFFQKNLKHMNKKPLDTIEEHKNCLNITN